MTRVFPLDIFLSLLPEFDDTAKYSRSRIQGCGNRALFHIGKYVDGLPMPPENREFALCLMAAHLIELDDISSSADGDGGAMAGTPFKATIGSVQIENTKQNSFTSDDYNWWLGQTKHGRELLAFLEVQAPLGVFDNTPQDSVRDLV